AAWTTMTGAPFTRAYSRSPRDCSDFGFGCDDPAGSYVDAYNGERTPDYRSLDLSARWSQALGRAELTAYLQVRNALARENAGGCEAGGPAGGVPGQDGAPVIVWEDRVERGLPRMLLLGLRVTL